MHIIPFVIITTLPFPILLVQCIHCIIQYIVHKTKAHALSRSAKCVFSAYALCLLFTFVALSVLQGLVLHDVINGLMLSEEESTDAVWMPKMMSIYCLSTFWGLSTHIGMPAAFTKDHPLEKIFKSIAGLTALASIVLSVFGSVLVVRMANSDIGYALLSCGNFLPYSYSCGTIWFVRPKVPKWEHWKLWCAWALNFLAAICDPVLMCLLPLHQTDWFLPGQLISIFASQIPWVLGTSINGITNIELENPKAQRLGSSAGSSKQDVPHKEEELLTMSEMLASRYHNTQSCEHDMESLNGVQQVGQAV